VLCRVAAEQLSDAQQELLADVTALQVADEAFGRALARHARVFRPLSDSRLRIHADGGTVTLAECAVILATSLDKAAARLDALWVEWEAAQAAVAEAARDILAAPDPPAGGPVDMSDALFREMIQQDMKALAAKALGEMAESEKVGRDPLPHTGGFGSGTDAGQTFKREIFDEQDIMVQAMMSQRSQYD